MLVLAPALQQAGAVVRWEATLRLTNDCSALVSQFVGNGFTDDPDFVASCGTNGTADAELDALTVVYDNPPVTTLDLYAQVRAEYDDFFGFGLTHGEYEIQADLFVEPLDGADYTAGSPGFLSNVPESGRALSGAAALTVLSGISGRRRC
jgi:hypothetical protein